MIRRPSFIIAALVLTALLAGFLRTDVSFAQPPADEPTADAQASDPPAEDVDEGGNADEPAINRWQEVTYPMITLAVGVAVVLGLIVLMKVNAFIALITAAMVLSLMAPGDVSSKIQRVADAFGKSAGGIGIVIALAAIIGTCMLESGAADRIVRAFLRVFGEKRSPIALMGSGFVLAVPVFFDTVFYLLVPLARSLHKKTNKQYLKYILAIGAGGAITHTLVPPTPGPLLMAETLGIDVGVMIMVGTLVAIPAAFAGLIFAGIADKLTKIPMRPLGGQPDPEPLPDDQLPPLWLSLLPVILPVVMISASTVLNSIADSEQAAAFKRDEIDWPKFQQRLIDDLNSDDPQMAADTNPSTLLLAHPSMKTVSEQLIQADTLTDGQIDEATAALNDLITRKDFFNDKAFVGVYLQGTTKSLADADTTRMNRSKVQRRNRLALEAAYPSITKHDWNSGVRPAANLAGLLGNANFALLVSTIIAMLTMVRQRGTSKEEMAKVAEASLMSGGVIILITAGGGAFGAMLAKAEIGNAIQIIFTENFGTGFGGQIFIVLGFLIACMLKIAQGSSTVAMIIGSSMIGAIIGNEELGYNIAYVATAVGGGSLVGSWMNDSGFWIFAKMGGLTETEALKTWSVMLCLLGFVCLGMSLLLANLNLF